MKFKLFDTHRKLVSQDERKAAMNRITIQDCKHKISIYVYVAYLKLLSLLANPVSFIHYTPPKNKKTSYREI